MMLLAHISDPHLGPLPDVHPGELMSKRAIGYINWRMNRGFDADTAQALFADVRAAGPAHIAVTGDLVNLALEAEYGHALAWLQKLGSPHDVTVVPGNHDAYVAEGIGHFTRQWLPFAAGDTPSPTMTFPFVRRRGPVALIGCSTAVATAPFMATGLIDAAQAEALGAALAETRGLCRVVLIHHPPVKGATLWSRRLIGAERVRDAIARHGAELVLHGHNHRQSLAWIDGADGPVPVVGAAAFGSAPHGKHRGGSYNRIRIEGDASPFRLSLTVRGVSEAGAVETRLERTLDRPGSH